jgi:hypothetical protein
VIELRRIAATELTEAAVAVVPQGNLDYRTSIRLVAALAEAADSQGATTDGSGVFGSAPVPSRAGRSTELGTKFAVVPSVVPDGEPVW